MKRIKFFILLVLITICGSNATYALGYEQYVSFYNVNSGFPLFSNNHATPIVIANSDFQA